MLAYCPLDLPRVDVDEDLLCLLVDEYNPGHHDGIWDTLPLVGRVSSPADFDDAAEFEKAWERRYDVEGKISYNEKVKEPLKAIFDHLQLLPMQVTHAQILRATKDIPRHYDMKHKQGLFLNDLPDDSYEPNGWKIQLNKTDEQSFFVSESLDAEPNYIKLPPDTNTFVINEKTYPHGSDYVEDKYIVSVFGIVDKDKADDLIERSSKVHQSYSLYF